ncbi:hypothetical protein EUX98_g372 [Antrodiella citrinella]|uniref:CWF21 domain-containing protein n=1 Tax=Antrodiella citrinella TaxID=2447956 RepID=A0A4S4N453_9APHY|nr:hypothetical protein EUX98_g372 [Antrodiella citrinella]
MYNGIGLTTPRGSGTNGYVVRNLSALRQHQSPADRANAWDTAPPKHREPDAAILEHERKRKVEVKCLELQLELEDKGVEEDKIEEEVSALRAKLLSNMSSAVDPKGLKPSDRHGIAAAKKEEMSRMARALGTRKDYQEGDAFDREKQEQIKMKRISEKEERERAREEERTKMQAQKEKWEAERKDRDRLRRREEDRRRKEREAAESEKRERMQPPPLLRGRDREPERGGAGAQSVVAPLPDATGMTMLPNVVLLILVRPRLLLHAAVAQLRVHHPLLHALVVDLTRVLRLPGIAVLDQSSHLLASGGYAEEGLVVSTPSRPPDSGTISLQYTHGRRERASGYTFALATSSRRERPACSQGSLGLYRIVDVGQHRVEQEQKSE